MNTAIALILLAFGAFAHSAELEERALKAGAQFENVDEALDGTVLAKGDKPKPAPKKAAPAKKAPPPPKEGGGFDFGEILKNLGGGVTPAVPAQKPAAATIFGRKKSRAMPEERVPAMPMQQMRTPMTIQRPTMQRPLVIRGPLQLVAESFSDLSSIVVFLASACVGAALTFMTLKRFLARRSTSASERLLTVTS